MQEAVALDPHLHHAQEGGGGDEKDAMRFETRVIKVDPLNFKDSELEEAVRLLREGEVVAFPTETVYGTIF